MWSLTLVFLLGLFKLFSCQDFDELPKDVCFRQIYICGDHRRSITASSGRFETDPFKFGEICRKQKEYIACVDDAISNTCNDSISDLAKFTLSNRYSPKMFCTNLNWRKQYLSSVPCLNKNYDKVQKDCEYEESIYVDDRPWWCLIQEPCDVIQRIFDCTVKKMIGLCGEPAAEVFRRLQILKAEDMDVVCVLRIKYPRYCRYERQKRHINADPKDQITSSSSVHDKPKTESKYNVVRAVLMDTVNVKEQKQQNFSGIIDSDVLKLRKLLSIAEESPNRVENGSKLFKRFGFQEDFNSLSDIAEINRLRRLAENEMLHFRKNSKALKDLHLRLKNHLFRVVDVLSHEEIIVGSLDEHFVDFYWTNLEPPIQSIVCDKISIASKNVFKCSIKWDYSENKLNASISSNSENQNYEAVSKDPLSDIHRVGYVIRDTDFEYKDNSYEGGYDSPGLIVPENLSGNPPIESSTEDLYSKSAEIIITKQSSDSKDPKTSEPPRKEKSQNDRKMETKEDDINSIEDNDEIFRRRLNEIKQDQLNIVRFARETELDGIYQDRRRLREVSRAIYENKLDRLNAERRHREKEIEALRKEIDEMRQDQLIIEKEYKELESQRAYRRIKSLQKLKEEILAHERAKAD